jgi:ATP-dependent Clp protease ATP-binding subunit ClpB
MEKFSVSRLVGAPPGYVGYEEGGQLTEAVRRRPYTVVLFDEIEKAHGDVFNILLQILEDGIITDSQGRTVSFKNTIIIMTSNIGSNYILEQQNQKSDEEIREVLLNELHKYFRPEFLNRVDEILNFHALSKDDIVKIVDIQLKKLSAKLEAHDIKFSIDDEAKLYLAQVGYDPAFGARPLKRTIIKLLETPVSRMLISGDLSAGDELYISLIDNVLKFNVNKLNDVKTQNKV